MYIHNHLKKYRDSFVYECTEWKTIEHISPDLLDFKAKKYKRAS
jgi:hypothetical protein